MTISSTNLYAVGDSNEIFNIFWFFTILFESFLKFGMTIRCTSIGKKKKYVNKISSSIIKSYLQTSSTFVPNIESTTLSEKIVQVIRQFSRHSLMHLKTSRFPLGENF